jgi:hypothetical protein
MAAHHLASLWTNYRVLFVLHVAESQGLNANVAVYRVVFHPLLL